VARHTVSVPSRGWGSADWSRRGSSGLWRWKFPSPRGVGGLPTTPHTSQLPAARSSFRPLAGLGVCRPESTFVGRQRCLLVSVPSRGWGSADLAYPPEGRKNSPSFRPLAGLGVCRRSDFIAPEMAPVRFPSPRGVGGLPTLWTFRLSCASCTVCRWVNPDSVVLLTPQCGAACTSNADSWTR